MTRPLQLIAGTALVGIGFMVLSGLTNTVMISAIKDLSSDLHPVQIGFFRCAIGLIVLLPAIWRAGGIAVLRTRHIGLHVLRGALNAAGMLAFFWAVSLAPLATVSAINFTAPLFATLLAILILGERVGVRRWGALAVGFAGTLVILRPGGEVMGEGALLALASSVVWAAAMIAIKRLTATDGTLAITAWAAFFVGLFALPPALLVWQWPSPAQWGWLAAIGALGSVVQLCLSRAFAGDPRDRVGRMQDNGSSPAFAAAAPHGYDERPFALADTSVVLPFDFLKLVRASLFGLLLFAEVPDLWTCLGGTVIFASSIYVAYRERRSGEAAGARRRA